MITTIHLPVKIVFGVGSIDQLGEEAKEVGKKAIIVTSSAAPAFLGRIFMRAPLTALKAAARCMGAKVVQSLYFGLVAQSPDSTLNQKCLRKAYKAGEKLAS